MVQVVLAEVVPEMALEAQILLVELVDPEQPTKVQVVVLDSVVDQILPVAEEVEQVQRDLLLH